ncbi:cupredoxin domain-containing protein [Siculibacillus lacustris]|uniref:Cupredoxin domain-containing protein n=1 Tax=Siculibacillus lacustris TaxID=1549641 RepID=A0A4Q9VRK0_9HYPH|nr:cupredoxin domain-containing protein [Siculibacillus lacustris]TBW38034.1 cupredoxin domain-containing protein [Siculibacillus lacustris]
MTIAHRILRLGAAVAIVAVAFGSARAEDEKTYRIEFRDGVITPLRLEVPADTRLRLELANVGTTPAEFESLELRKEKVIAPGSDTVMVIRRLDPGEYPFFDDFHLDMPRAVVVAK